MVQNKKKAAGLYIHSCGLRTHAQCRRMHAYDDATNVTMIRERLSFNASGVRTTLEKECSRVGKVRLSCPPFLSSSSFGECCPQPLLLAHSTALSSSLSLRLASAKNLTDTNLLLGPQPDRRRLPLSLSLYRCIDAFHVLHAHAVLEEAFSQADPER